MNKIARQFGYDQVTPSAAPSFLDFIESQGRFLLANLGGLVAGHENTLLPVYDRAGAFTIGFHLSWRRNLDSFPSVHPRKQPRAPAICSSNTRCITALLKSQEPGLAGHSQPMGCHCCTPHIVDAHGPRGCSSRWTINTLSTRGRPPTEGAGNEEGSGGGARTPHRGKASAKAHSHGMFNQPLLSVNDLCTSIL